PGFLCGERRAPDGENLRALVDALKTLLGLGDCFNRRNPEILDERSMQRNADALPAVFHPQDWAGHATTEAKILFAERSFKKAVGLRGRKEIDNRLDADGYGLLENIL